MQENIRKHTRWLIAATLVAAVAATGILGWSGQPVSGATDDQSIATLKDMSRAFNSVAEDASNAVVYIEVEKEVTARQTPFGGGGMPPGLFERFFGQPMPQAPQGGEEGTLRPFGQGSGFIISEDGYIVTNHHVVGDADRVSVELMDGREYEAELIGTDPRTEVALIKIDEKNLPTLPLGNSDNLQVGEWVLAVGSPFGLSHTVTAGIVSARGRGNVGIVDYADFIQTDASINPGNSGGPLVNLDGQVVGLNTAIISRSGGNNGIGLAVPINMVKNITDQLRENGAIQRGFLGIGIQDLDDDLAQWFDIDGGNGILVSEVQPDSPAEKAGLKQDDVIVGYNGQAVEGAGSFRSRVASTRPGEKVELEVMRDGKKVTKTAKLGTLDEDLMVAKEAGAKSSGETKLGLAVQDLDSDLADRFGYESEKGVVVSGVKPGSPAARAGIRPGELIQEVNRQEVASVKDFRKALKDDSERGALLRVTNGEMSRYVALEARG
jgi:serine protease Do